MAALFLAAAPFLHGADCLPLTASEAASLSKYVANEYDAAPDIRVHDDGTVNGSCFRRLTFQIASPERTLVLFLSPDQHFLSSELLDLGVDPGVEKQRVASATEADLTAGDSPSIGPADAPITIVEFSDFQCPFCRRFEMLLRSPELHKENVRIIYKQHPLAIHGWARKAALATICANAQGNAAFWRMHDFLVDSQRTMTTDNVDQQINSFVQHDNQLNASEFGACVTSKQAADILQRDEALGDKYNIHATPTIFINGVRKRNFQSAQELQDVIDQMRASASGNLPRPEEGNTKRSSGTP